MDDNLEKYLRATSFLDCDTPALKQKSAELTSGKQDEIEKAKSLFYFVRDSIRYNLYVPRSRREHFKASRILERGQGYCVQKAVLLAALARAANIPAGLGFARIANHRMPE